MRQMMPVDEASYLMAHSLESEVVGESVAVLDGYAPLVQRVMEELA
jgi:hypothetical protein